MAFKQFKLDDQISVVVYKRSASRNLRLTMSHDGQAKVSIPRWAPYRAGVQFARARLDWIKQQQPLPVYLKDGQAIGKAHRMQFTASQAQTKPSSRIRSTVVEVKYPPLMSLTDPELQATARRACVRALRKQAEELLPQRLQQLAQKHGYSYKQVTIKQMKSRWGSCDQYKNINLNLYLMQLPWDLIDYVLLHELTHTVVLKHGPEFWQAMSSAQPKTAEYRKQMRAHRPVLVALGGPQATAVT